MISNPIYIGKLRYQGKVYDAEHEGIISPELWQNAQETLKANKRIEKIFEAMKKNPPHKDNIGIVCRCILQLDNHKIKLANAKRELKAIDDLKKWLCSLHG